MDTSSYRRRLVRQRMSRRDLPPNHEPLYIIPVGHPKL
jgi:hypothetical protein